MINNKAKYLQLADWLRQELKKPGIKPGIKFFSENQLCKKFSLSRQTVRKAIDMLIQEGLLESRRGSGTYVLSGGSFIKPNKTYTIGILVTYLSDYIFPIIINELEAVFTRNNYYVHLASTGNSIAQERRLILAMLDKGVDGMILEPTKSALPNPNRSYYKEIKEQKLPLICINSCFPDIDFPYVALDDRAAGKMATEYLIEQGHYKIGCIFKSDDLQGHLRYAGYQEAMIINGLEINDKNTYWYTTEDKQEFKENSAHILRRLEGCSAVVCYNDQIALSIIQILSDADIKVPEDLSLISIDDSRLASISMIPLTSIHNPSEKVGRVAAENLLKLISGQDIDATHIFTPTITVRNSVQPYKRKAKQNDEV